MCVALFVAIVVCAPSVDAAALGRDAASSNVEKTSLSTSASSLAAPAAVTLVSFDGNPATTYEFSVMNDPVMGGVSSSNFSTVPAEKLSLFEVI